ncbi:hypothetical protein [Curtobacterium sp. VKM Ac-1376]|uniref:hypothetical protein n=1 Tax=Curtobacterium sp. VKM Ac-1376 TaxID=123312 RepID=UPI00188D1DEA|nr:hypothetical protein [Curtobacterium sp. VKM Ac-1376]MBF4615716.1 hypothetical protein [Curtobacterium sp. VKM Ac-1376]
MLKNLTVRMGNCDHHSVTPPLIDMVAAGQFDPTGMERTRPASNSAPTTKEPTMSLELHKSTGAAIDDERTCLPKPVLSALHEDRTPAFGRWLGQINRQD